MSHAAQPGKDMATMGASAESPGMCDKQRARSAGKRGRSRATPSISRLLPTKGQPRESPPSAKKGPLVMNVFGHSHFARKGLEKRNKSWYFTHVTLGKGTRAGHKPKSAVWWPQHTQEGFQVDIS